MKILLGIIFIIVLVVIAVAIGSGWNKEEQSEDPRYCSRCGKKLDKIKPCPYNYYHYYTCDECCEDCHKYEPFECEEYHKRKDRDNHERNAQ